MSSEQLGGRNTTVKETWVGGRRERYCNMENSRFGEKTLLGQNVWNIFFFYNK